MSTMSSAFRVSGRFKMGLGFQKFTLTLAVASADAARERCFSLLGSRHGVARRLVRIASVDEVPMDQVDDAVVRKQAESM